MEPAGLVDSTIKFGVFEVDPRSGELRKSGSRIKLQDQPFKVLLALLEHPGEVVTREELRRRIWPTESFGDFDHAVNVAVAKLRTALGDSADIPRYVETLPRRGYRFVFPVTPSTDRKNGFMVGTLEHESASAPDQSKRQRTQWRFAKLVGLGIGVLASLIILLVALDIGRLRERLLNRSVAPHIESLAVLPLENLSQDPEQEYFADGMTDEVIADLAKINALRVISRTSVMHYKGTRKTVPEIARELHVDGIIEGSVLRSGNHVRITAQLIQASTDTHLWAESYERDLRDVLAMQDEVAQAIAAEIKVNLTPQEQARLSGARQVNPEAHELYLKGRYYWNKRTPEALKKSLEYFQEAVEKDPHDALAYAGLADAYGMLGAGNFAVLPPKEAYPAAEAAATRALRLDDTLAEAHTSLGWARHVWDWDWAGAEREYKQAIELNPSYANAHHWYATYLDTMGRYTEALAEDRKAESLDPLSLVISADVAGEALIPAGLYDQAVEQCQKTLEMDPNFPIAHWYLGTAYLGKGMYNDAFTEIQKAIDLSGGSAVFVSQLGAAYARAGRRDDAIKMLNELKVRSKREFVLPDAFVYIYAALGDKNQAFAWLEKAYEERTDAMTGLKADARFDPLRSDPRFKDLLRRVGFPQ